MGLVENNLNRREIIKITGLGLFTLSVPGCTSVPGSNSVPFETLSSRSNSFSEELNLPFGSKFIVETKPPHPNLTFNKALVQELLDKRITKPIAHINVSIYSDDWVCLSPDNRYLLINDSRYQNLRGEEKIACQDARSNTLYSPTTRKAQLVEVHLAAGRYLTFAERGEKVMVKNEFAPEGLITDPIIALNATFYHEVFYHAILRDSNYRKKEDSRMIEEEQEAQLREIELIKSFEGSIFPDYQNRLFLQTLNP